MDLDTWITGRKARDEWNQVSNPYTKRYSAEFKRDAVALVIASPDRTADYAAHRNSYVAAAL